MNYAIKILKDRAELINDFLRNKEEEYQNAHFESSFDEEIMRNDIENLKLQKQSLVDAIDKLR